MNALGGTTYTSVGVHSPNRYVWYFNPTVITGKMYSAKYHQQLHKHGRSEV